MALETFDFSSFPLRSLRVSDFLKRLTSLFFCGQVDCKLGTFWAARSAKCRHSRDVRRGNSGWGSWTSWMFHFQKEISFIIRKKHPPCSFFKLFNHQLPTWTPRYEGSSPAMVLVLLLGDGTFMTATGQQWMIQWWVGRQAVLILVITWTKDIGCIFGWVSRQWFLVSIGELGWGAKEPPESSKSQGRCDWKTMFFFLFFLKLQTFTGDSWFVARDP